MQCLILAGGLGTRMRVIGGDKPKALLPVGSLTFIDVQLQWLKLLGVNSVVLALGHGSEMIEAHVRGHSTKLKFPDLKFSYDGPKLLGTGGAIRKAAPLLEGDFMVLYGDSFLFIDLYEFQKIHLKSGLPMTMSIFRNLDAGDKSNVVFKNDRILKYDKVDRSIDMEFIDYGLTYLKRDMFLNDSSDGVFDLASYMSHVAARGLAQAFVAKELFHEIGSPTGYERFLTMMSTFQFDLELLKKSKI